MKNDSFELSFLDGAILLKTNGSTPVFVNEKLVTEPLKKANKPKYKWVNVYDGVVTKGDRVKFATKPFENANGIIGCSVSCYRDNGWMVRRKIENKPNK